VAMVNKDGSFGEWKLMAGVVSNADAVFIIKAIELPCGKAGFKHGDRVELAFKIAGGQIIRSDITLVGKKGYTIISDIDDTVKDTQVLAKLSALRRTFCLDFSPIPGMPELYQAFSKRLVLPGKTDTQKHAPTFHYLSASPFELHPLLMQFLTAFKFPPATILPSPYRLISVIKSLNMDLRQYKAAGSKFVISQFPERTYLLIGDSGQMDPEGYGDVYRDVHPGTVQCILIRLVTGQNSKIEAAKNSPERFRAAFFNVPQDKWRVFDNGKDLMDVPFEKGACYKEGEKNTWWERIQKLATPAAAPATAASTPLPQTSSNAATPGPSEAPSTGSGKTTSTDSTKLASSSTTPHEIGGWTEVKFGVDNSGSLELPKPDKSAPVFEMDPNLSKDILHF